MKAYRLKKSLLVFRNVFKLYQRKKKKLPEKIRRDLATSLKTLQNLLMEKDREGAFKQAKEVEHLFTLHLKKILF